jgi:hypothetical protein
VIDLHVDRNAVEVLEDVDLLERVRPGAEACVERGERARVVLHRLLRGAGCRVGRRKDRLRLAGQGRISGPRFGSRRHRARLDFRGRLLDGC